MKLLYRLALCLALLNALTFAAIAFVFYVWARPEWGDVGMWRNVEATLRDSGTPVETIRQIALDGHTLIMNSLTTTEIAVEMVLFSSASTALCLGYIGYVLRARVRSGNGAL